MTSVYTNCDLVDGPWGGGNNWLRAWNNSLLLHPQLQINKSIFGADVVMLSSLNATAQHAGATALVDKRTINQCFFIRINECDARKNTSVVDDEIIAIANECDGVIFVSKWLQNYYGDRIKTKSVVIHNGCDKYIFNTAPKISALNDKINIVCHHWSDNPHKGEDYYNALVDFCREKQGYTFTFIGRTKTKNLMLAKADSVPSHAARHISPLSGLALGAELGRYDVCINASRHDPGPNSVLETISCQIPTYVHADGGGAVEFAGADHVFQNFDDVKKLLEQKTFVANVYVPLSWDNCIAQYISFIEDVLK